MDLSHRPQIFTHSDQWENEYSYCKCFVQFIMRPMRALPTIELIQKNPTLLLFEIFINLYLHDRTFVLALFSGNYQTICGNFM